MNSSTSFAPAPAVLEAYPAHVGEALTCPLCGRPVDPRLGRALGRIEPHIVRQLHQRHPGWRVDDGACPACVQAAVYAARHARSPHSLQPELITPYPVYHHDETSLLPTPLRVRASPQFTGQGVTVALLDSGFYPHVDLVRPRNRVVAYVDAIGPAPAEKPVSRRRDVTAWHGLMVAGVGFGSGHASGGLYRGLASDARLVLVKTGNRRRALRITDRDIARALQWVVDNAGRFNIRVLNISLGGDFPCTGALGALDALVQQAAARGLLVVAAAGNGDRNHVIPPASAPAALTVGGVDDQNSLDRSLVRLHNTNYGRGAYGVLKPDLVAPARWLAAPMLPQTRVHNEAHYLWHLLHESDEALQRHLEDGHAEARFRRETLRLPLDEIRRVIRRRLAEQKVIHPHYQHVDGTSMAAPIVSAIAAQMLEANPHLSAERLKEILCATADPLPHTPRTQQGAGLVNGARAVAVARRLYGGTLAGQPLSPHASPEAITLSYHDPLARSVAVVGAFNNWLSADGLMRPVGAGLWQILLPRPAPGEYPYRFLVDGVRAVRDPENPELIEDGRGGYNSLLII